MKRERKTKGLFFFEDGGEGREQAPCLWPKLHMRFGYLPSRPIPPKIYLEPTPKNRGHVLQAGRILSQRISKQDPSNYPEAEEIQSLADKNRQSQ